MSRNSTFALRLKLLLEERRMTQAELAARLDVRPATVTGWVKGSWPGEDHFLALVRTLGVSGHWLLTGDGPMLYSEDAVLELAAIRKIADGTAPDEIVRTLVEGSSRPSGDDGRETADRVREALDSVRPAARRKKEA